MKEQLIILFTLFICPAAILAQSTSTIHGMVQTSDHKAVSSANVHITGTKRYTQTDAGGHFSFDHLPAGRYTLEISLVGHETVRQSIQVNPDQSAELNIQLTISRQQLGDVVVTGQYAPQSVRNSVYRVRVINSELINMRNATDVLGVLNNELGIRLSNDLTLGESDVQIMGMNGQNVKVLLDGVPLIDRNATKQSLSQIDINTIERIEIVEGPMSVVYGADALAGVINIITKKNSPKGNRLGVTVKAQEETAGKEYDPFVGKGVHNEYLGLTWQNKGWHAEGSLTRNNFGGWQGQDTGRAKEWHPKDQWLAGGTAGYRNDRINLWYRLNYLNEKIHALGDANPNTYQATDQDYITDRFTHQLQFAWNISAKLNLNSAASYQDYTRSTQTTVFNTKTGERFLSLDSGAQDVSKFNSFFFRTTAQYLISPVVSLQPGIEYQRDNASGQRIAGSPVITNYAFFISSEIKPWPGVNIRPGIRLSKNSTYDAPPVVPSLNTRFTLGKAFDLRLSYARGFRAPALRELYFWFFDANHSIEGNPNLKAEYSNSFNGSLAWHPATTKSWLFSSALTGFYNDFNNRIDLALAGPNSNVYTYINISKYRTTGGTWENSFEWKQLKATLGVSYIGRYNQYADDTTYNKTQSLPGFVWSPEINSNILYTFRKAGMQLGLFYKYTGELPIYELATVNNQEEVHLSKTAAYHWLDFTASKTLGSYLSLNGGVKNIFNVTRLNNTSLDQDGAHSTGGPVPMSYGRSYFLALQFNWTTHSKK